MIDTILIRERKQERINVHFLHLKDQVPRTPLLHTQHSSSVKKTQQKTSTESMLEVAASHSCK